MAICRICGNDSSNNSFTTYEKLFGTLEEFEYFTCSKCGALQILQVPENLSKYYSEGYYSISDINKNYIKSYLKSKWYAHCLGNKNFIGSYIKKKKGCPDFISWLSKIEIPLDSAILDVGSGAGILLNDMYLCGYRDLTGCEPHIEKDIVYNNHCRVLKKYLHEIDRSFDLIIFNYSFEHIPEPEQTLITASAMMKKGSYLVNRVPMADSYAWEKYGLDWFALDPPRQLHIFTENSMQLLAERAGLVIKEMVYDSNSSQFWGSIIYQNNLPATVMKYADPVRSVPELFNYKMIDEFNKQSIELNSQKRGDLATFIMQKI